MDVTEIDKQNLVSSLSYSEKFVLVFLSRVSRVWKT